VVIVFVIHQKECAAKFLVGKSEKVVPLFKKKFFTKYQHDWIITTKEIAFWSRGRISASRSGAEKRNSWCKLYIFIVTTFVYKHARLINNAFMYIRGTSSFYTFNTFLRQNMVYQNIFRCSI